MAQIECLEGHSAVLIARTCGDYPVNPSTLIANTARVCRAGESDHTLKEDRHLCKKLMAWGHETPFEFLDLTFYCTTTRAVTHELVRHRMASYMQESQRYCSYKETLRVIPPATIKAVKAETLSTSVARFDVWYQAVKNSLNAYCKLLDLGIKPEDARTVLPSCTATNIQVKMNLREFRHFLKLRLAPAAWPEMRLLAQAMTDTFRNLYPTETYLIADVCPTPNTPSEQNASGQ